MIAVQSLKSKHYNDTIAAATKLASDTKQLHNNTVWLKTVRSTHPEPLFCLFCRSRGDPERVACGRALWVVRCFSFACFAVWLNSCERRPSLSPCRETLPPRMSISMHAGPMRNVQWAKAKRVISVPPPAKKGNDLHVGNYLCEKQIGRDSRRGQAIRIID